MSADPSVAGRIGARLVAPFRTAIVPMPVRIALDRPEPQTVHGGLIDIIHIDGWAFSEGARIVGVVAHLAGERALLSFGLPRPDVAAGFGTAAAERAGFTGTLTIPAMDADRDLNLIVRATNEIGEVGEVEVPLRLSASKAQSHSVQAGDPTALGVRPDILARIVDVLEEAEARLGVAPSLLDWGTGAEIASAFPATAVVVPPADLLNSLPYLDRSIDIVVVGVIRGDDPVRPAEARRVASLAVVAFPPTGAGGAGASAVRVEWSLDAQAAPELPTVSIVIPVYNHAEYTDACLARVIATLPAAFRGDILVVDDASSDETPAMLARWTGADPRVRTLRRETNGGFVASCNAGAEAATGEILVFLNNDTLPRPGWLTPLVRTLEDRTVGVVGGKLTYPDGRLQEAGAVVFADGSACNFGRGDPDPDGPLYDFVREVDYCSGALLAVRRDVFRDAGGFDRRFSPGYYEDVDLCFRLRDSGYRVVFQPASVVVHVEGASSGTNPDAGMKRFQGVHQDVLVEQWRLALARQPLRPARLDSAARAALVVRDGRRRAFVAAPVMPEYDREGGSRRVFHLIEFLQESGWAVTFAPRDATDGARYARVLRQRGVAVHTRPPTRDEGLYFDDLIADGRFDLAIVAFWHTGDWLLPRLRSLSPMTRVIVDSIDLHFLREARQALRRPAAGARPGQLDADGGDRMRRELNTYAAADAVLAVSDEEARYIEAFTGDRQLASTVPLAEDLALSPIGRDHRRGTLFVGNFRHEPNREGLAWFCGEVLPRVEPSVLAAHPVFVVGNGVDDEVRAIVEGVPHVRLVGWVPTLVPYFNRARMSVVPLLHGAGTKTKLIQSLMTGTPSVSSSIGVEGLGLEHDRHVLVADAPDAFAAAMARLATDGSLWDRLSREGRTHIEQRHARAAVRTRFQAVVDRVMNA